MWLALAGIAGAAGLLAATRKAWAAGVGLYDDASAREDEADVDASELGYTVGLWDEVGLLVEESLGWPYWYGRGGPSTPWWEGAEGVDCSGYAQMVLVQLGKLDATATDRSARALADACDPVALGDQQPGDLAYYPGHVMVCAGPPAADGHCPVAGASGGTSDVHGDDPDARVKLFASGLYRGDFVTYMRLKA